MELDKIDVEIIKLLQKDGRMPFKSVADYIGVSETTIRKRVQKLKNEGVFQIVAVCDPIKLGFPISGLIKVQVDPQYAGNVFNELKKMKEIWYIAVTTGSHDLDIEFNARSLQELEKLIFEKIYKIKGVIKAESSIVMNYLKRTYEWGTEYDS